MTQMLLCGQGCTGTPVRPSLPSGLSFSISSISGPLDFEAYSAAALQEGKYVWAWMPSLDHGAREADLNGKGAPSGLSSAPLICFQQ